MTKRYTPPAAFLFLISSMCPERVCTVCGEPSRRIVSREQVSTGRTMDRKRETGTSCQTRTVSACKTIGWTDCGCPGDHWRPGVVLDPFAGSGTTLHVAHGLGRDSIGIDIDERSIDLVTERFGPLQAAMYLDVREALDP